MACEVSLPKIIFICEDVFCSFFFTFVQLSLARHNDMTFPIYAMLIHFDMCLYLR